MLRTLWTAATGMQSMTLKVDVIANNLANVNTTGFKRNRADFQDLLYQNLRPAGTSAAAGSEIPTGIQLGHGSRPVATQKIFVQGDYQQTGNQLDLAIEGDGFFQVTQPNGTIAYTRAGSFKVNSQGQVVTSDGFLLEPAITIPTDAISIAVGTDGTVSVLQAGQAAATELGTIELTKFINPAGLQAIGRNLYLETAASGAPQAGTAGEDGLGTIAQGFLEMSNVNVVDEMVNMITAQRAYEINSKAIQTADDMLLTANDIKR